MCPFDLLYFSLHSKWTKAIHSITMYGIKSTTILSVKPRDTQKCVCLFYRPAHHMNWLQLLTPTLNITNCHMYMSTVVLQMHSVMLHSFTSTHQMAILNSVTVLLLYTSKIIQYIWANDKKYLFYNSRLWIKRFMYNKKESSIPIYSQQDATLHSSFISGNYCTCFEWHLHPSSAVHTASGICHTVTATCSYHGGVGTLPR